MTSITTVRINFSSGIRLILILCIIVLIKGQTDTSCATLNTWGCVTCTTPGDVVIFNINTSLYTCANKQNCLQVNNLK